MFFLFDPLARLVPGAAFRWRADAVTLVGGSVSSWRDLTGNGIAANQPVVGQRGVWNASTINGKPGVEFSSVGLTEYDTASVDWTGVNSWHSFTVMSLGISSSVNVLSKGVFPDEEVTVALNYNGPRDVLIVSKHSGSVRAYDFTSSHDKLPVNGTPFLLEMRCDQSQPAADELQIHLNGVRVTLLGAGVVDSVGTYANTPFVFGGGIDATICEQIMFPSIASASERNAILSYVRGHYLPGM